MHARHGFTLVEVLVGLTITLIILLVMTRAFKFASEEMTRGRASVELTNRLRTAESLLRKDLDRLTVEPRSYYNAATEPKGYFEIVDGFATDTNSLINTLATPPTNPTVIAGLAETSIKSLMVGDHDDLWCGTIRSDSQPFRGRNGTFVQESHLAEVIWFTIPNDLDSNSFIEVSERVNLFRRVLLIRPDITLVAPVDAGGTTVPLTGIASFINAQLVKQLYLRSSDISVRVQFNAATADWSVVPNSLRSLSIRTNRFFTAAHGTTLTFATYRLPLRSSRSADNQDILINDVLAFDIQIFDPTASVTVQTAGGLVRSLIEPTDCGNTTFVSTFDYASEAAADTTNNFPAALGAYVDLGKTASGQFTSLGNNFLEFRDQVYDTGTPLYDRNNVDDNNDDLIDEGGDKIDNDSDGLIDEGVVDTNLDGAFSAAEIASSEKEVQPSFAAPIRGLSVKIRLMEPTTGQVSQTTVKKSF